MSGAPVRTLDIQGHRGARGLAPENTLAAFAVALELGVTTLELDCAVTRDDVLVVSHDRALNPHLTRGPDGRWLEGRGPVIRALDYTELRRFDVGCIDPASGYARRWPRQQPADGARIPRLTEVFELVRARGNENVRFNIETKLSPLAPREAPPPEAFARLLIETVRNAGLARRVAIQSLDWRTLAVVQREAPEIETVYLTCVSQRPANVRPEGISPWTAGLVFRDHGSVPRMVKAAGGHAWSPYQGDLTREAVEEAHALGLRVIPWTVNRTGDMRRLIGWGVDGLITDYPDRLLRVARDAGPAAPPASQ